VAVQQGRQHQAITWLDRAAELADSPAEHARILGVRGITLDDTGRHRDALETLCASGRLAAEHDEVRQLAWTLAMRARTHLQLGEHGEAEPLVAEALRLTRLQNWSAFLSYPLTQLAELQLLDGDHDAAVENLEHALALGCHIGDPCWEALAERGLAWELSMRGKTEAAVAELSRPPGAITLTADLAATRDRCGPPAVRRAGSTSWRRSPGPRDRLRALHRAASAPRTFETRPPPRPDNPSPSPPSCGLRASLPLRCRRARRPSAASRWSHPQVLV
jgi:ATP/maltotriose-dependent transcriptional regulator MalT